MELLKRIDKGPYDNEAYRLTGIEHDENLQKIEDSINTVLSNTQNKVLDYSIQWVPNTYKYIVTVRKYIFKGVIYTNTIVATVTLDPADNTYNRFDTFLINTLQNIVVLKGDATEFPGPKEYDPELYVYITFKRVDANTTAPTNAVENVWYNENLQEAGGEKNTSTVNPTYVTLASTEQASVGTKSVKIVGKNHVYLTSTTKYNCKDLTNILIDVFCTTANNVLRLQFWVDETSRTGEAYIYNGMFGYNAALTNQWQTLNIPSEALSYNGFWNSEEYDSLFIGNNSAGGTIYIDNVRLQSGIAQTATTNLLPNSVGLNELKQEVLNALFPQRVDMGASDNLNWADPNATFVKNQTANSTFTFTNLPTGTKTKTITLHLNPGTYSGSFPAYCTKIGANVIEPSVKNILVFKCINGNSGNEIVEYTVNPNV